MKEAIERLYP